MALSAGTKKSLAKKAEAARKKGKKGHSWTTRQSIIKGWQRIEQGIVLEQPLVNGQWLG